MKRWNFEEEALLKEKYPVVGNKELAKLFPDKTISSIKCKAFAMGLKKANQHFRFTKEQLNELKRDYPTTLNADLAKRFGCAIWTIENAGHRHQLKKDKKFIADVFRKKMEDPNHPGRKFWAKKGDIPHNKGKKQNQYMRPEAIERSKATRFKKGYSPKNKLYNNAITERADRRGVVYKFIRIRSTWIPYHRHIWEQAHGEIPKGVNIQFKDGNTLNCDLANLYAVSRKNQMKENSGPINLPDNMVAIYLAGKRGKDKEFVEALKEQPELLELKRQQLLLSRKIREKDEKN